MKNYLRIALLSGASMLAAYTLTAPAQADGRDGQTVQRDGKESRDKGARQKDRGDRGQSAKAGEGRLDNSGDKGGQRDRGDSKRDGGDSARDRGDAADKSDTGAGHPDAGD